MRNSSGTGAALSKKILRDKIQSKRDMISAADRSILSRVICNTFINSNFFSRAQQKGHFNGRNPEILSFLLLALLREAFFQYTIYNDFNDLEKLIHELISLIIFGLRGRDEASPTDQSD